MPHYIHMKQLQQSKVDCLFSPRCNCKRCLHITLFTTRNRHRRHKTCYCNYQQKDGYGKSRKHTTQTMRIQEGNKKRLKKRATFDDAAFSQTCSPKNSRAFLSPVLLSSRCTIHSQVIPFFLQNRVAIVEWPPHSLSRPKVDFRVAWVSVHIQAITSTHSFSLSLVSFFVHSLSTFINSCFYCLYI
jgi:hypothetical protein